MVWELKSSTGTSELILHRGEELLEVNGKAVKGKKLAEIYKLILDQASADVQLKIKAIQPNMSGVEGTSNINQCAGYILLFWIRWSSAFIRLIQKAVTMH